MTRPEIAAQSNGLHETLVTDREDLLRQLRERRQIRQRAIPRVRHNGVDLSPCTLDCPACLDERAEIELLNRIAER